MALGIRGSNPIWLMVNLTGKLFDDTYWMFVLSNQIPYIPARIFHDPDLSEERDNPVRFLANGTLPNDIYYEPNMVYRLEFRKNNGLAPPSQSDPLIYLVENYVPGEGGSTPVDTVATLSSNQITNPQFSIINFNSAPSGGLPQFTYTGPASSLPISGKINIAPGWFLNLAGSGTVTVIQTPLNNAEPNPSNAPYALRIALSGWTANSVFLSQRFEQNGMLWANQYVSSAITASLGPDELPQNISAQLVDSNGTFLTTVLDPVPVVPAFNEFTDYGQLPETSNPDIPPAAYIEYQLLLPSNIDIFVTSIQLIVEDVPVEPSFDQDSINRQIDHMFNYYYPLLSVKPISSLLTAWDFILNPMQFGSSIASQPLGTNTAYYAWDQTIVFQKVSNSVTVARNNQFLNLTATANTQMGIIQYLGGTQAAEVFLQALESSLSTNIKVGAAGGGSQGFNISLWWTTNASLPALSGGASFILDVDANGHPNSVVSGWNEIKWPFGNANFTISANGTINSMDFSGFANGFAYLTGTFFAIAVTTSQVTSGNSLLFQSVSLVPGLIATPPAPQSPDQVLRQCQYYYTKSFLPGITPANYYSSPSVNSGEAFGVQTIAGATSNIGPIVQYSTQMRVSPSVTLYNPVNNNANIFNATGSSDWSGSTFSKFSANGFVTIGTGHAGSAVGDLSAVHYTADARLGLI
jgi:hypothetical protein